jgi:uncharacterized LabA/DUF88 family protein
MYMPEERIQKRNVAYIDAANLYNAVKDLDWRFDYKRFRVWLREKYNVEQAYIFLGLIPKYADLYTYLNECGFTLVLKDVTYGRDGKVKGNCDADIVVKAMRDAFENKYEKVILVSSDGDYASLVSFLIEKEKLETVLSVAPPQKCSILLKRTGAKIVYIQDQRGKLEKPS